MSRLLIILLALFLPTQAFSQATVLQGGSWTAGRVPMYSASGGGSQPTVQQSAPASGGAQSISELSLIARGTGTAPFVGQGTGFLGSIACLYDGPTTGAYHQLCLSPDATGGFGLLSYNAFGGASNLPFKMNINGTTLEFPFIATGVVGPGSSVVNNLACWNNVSGTLLKDCGAPLTVGGTTGQIQYNNAGVLGGFALSGDCTFSVPAITCQKIGGEIVNLGGTFATGDDVSFPSFNPVIIHAFAPSEVNLPASGTLATLTGAEAFLNKTYNGLSIDFTSSATLDVTGGKTFAITNTLTLSGTDGSTLNVGAGGVLGTAAYTASTAYVASGTQVQDILFGDTDLTNTANYFLGPSVAQGSSGTWWCSGSVTVLDTAGGATFSVKMWDGAASVAASGYAITTVANQAANIAMSGYVASPAGNMRISVKDSTATTGKIKFNASGNSRDSLISCFRQS